MNGLSQSIAIAAAALLVSACGGTLKAGGDTGTDTGIDTTPADTAVDTTPDIDPDMPADTFEDTPPDTGMDAPPDTETDAPPDLVPDTEPDVVIDTAPDVLPDAVCPLVQITFEAEAMTFDDGFGTAESSRAYIGTYLESLSDDYGVASISLDIPCADDWYLWGLAWWGSGASDSFYWTWDTWPETWVWDVMQQCGTTITADWYWDLVTQRTETGSCGAPEYDPAVMTLGAGAHLFYLMGREGDTAVDEFILTNDPSFVPVDPG